MSDDLVCASVRLPESLNEAIEEELDYGDTKDGWILSAIELRLERERERERDPEQRP